jgi:hypothetical protein
MISILCSPKPFVDEAAWNQLNALRSWRAIHPDVEIFVFGSPVGAVKVAQEVKAKLVPEIECSASGAPSFNAMNAYMAQQGQYDLQVYVNCDIILNETIIAAMQTAHQHFGKFLLVGERLDLAQAISLDTREFNWIAKLDEFAAGGQLTSHGPTGADYFGYVRGMWKELPPVYMGRAMCDQALLHYSLKHHVPIIDASLAILAVHQYHDYQHVSGGRAEVFGGADLSMMAKAHGLHHSLPTVADAEWRFGEKGAIESNRLPGRFLRRVELALRYQFRLEWVALFMRLLQRLGGEKAVLPKKRPATTLLSTCQRKPRSDSHYFRVKDDAD